MFTKLRIQNYKSIHELELELGRVNVFIGENGCGEEQYSGGGGAVSTAKEGRLRLDDLADKGIRVARNNMMVNAFEDTIKEDIKVELEHKGVFLAKAYIEFSPQEHIIFGQGNNC